jgi:cytoskeletal protein CcmA (bactofilin family)
LAPFIAADVLNSTVPSTSAEAECLLREPIMPPEDGVLKRDKERVGTDFGEIRAFLGEGTQFKGVLSFAGAVRVDGQLEGEIVGDEVLIIGEPGQVKAEIDVGTVVISGQVQGNITAKQRVELLRPSRVTGTIRTPCLVVAEGAFFNGNCEMIGPDEGKVVPLQPTEEGLQAAERA